MVSWTPPWGWSTSLILITTTGLGLTLLATCVVLPALLAVLANNRNKRPVPWALIGAIPLVNIVGLILLLWTPLPSDLQDEEDEQWDEPWSPSSDQAKPPTSEDRQ